MKAFTGNFTFKVDRKGRISVPAEYRAILSAQANGQDAGILAFPWFDYPAIRGCGLELMERIAANRSPTAVFENAPIDSALISAADMVQMPFDGEGRVVLPRELAEHAGIGDSATFVGQVNFFEIWNPASFKAHQAARRALRAPAGGG
ncbi:MAG TPA: division/cell wall cluster transcriptional repressor MraZ [Alphaproteobacteria bacterium]